jgi:hypothetical protein
MVYKEYDENFGHLINGGWSLIESEEMNIEKRRRSLAKRTPVQTAN